MNDPRFRPRFEQMVAGLEAHPHIAVTHVEIAPPLTASDADALRGRLPEEILAFYREMNGFTLEWQHRLPAVREGNDRDRGSIDILPAEDVLSDWKGRIWFDEPGGDEHKDVKPLDFFAAEACAALQANGDDVRSPRIYYHYLGEFLCDTGYDFNDWIDRLLMSRGSFYWVVTLCPSFSDSPEARAFFRRMPLLFPDFDPAFFRPGNQGLPKITPL